MSTFFSFNEESLGEGRVYTLPVDRVLEGSPVFTSWKLEQAGLITGAWEATPGTHRVERDGSLEEVFTVVRGRIVMTPDGEEPRAYGPGDTVVMKGVWKGTWTTLETVRKVFVQLNV